MGLIASNFGGVKHPAWYFNLQAHPRATVTIGRDTWRATSRLAIPGERDEIWAKGIEIYPGWRKYESRAGDRRVEAFVLSRDGKCLRDWGIGGWRTTRPAALNPGLAGSG